MDATIRESFRFYTAIPSGVAHTATNATKIMGYDIPQVTEIFSNNLHKRMDSVVIYQLLKIYFDLKRVP